MTILSTHQSPAPFHPLVLRPTKENKSHFVDMNFCNPIWDTRPAMALGLLALQNGKPVVFPNSHLYKMANMRGKQTSLSHLDPKNPSKQFLSMLHPYVPFSIYLYQSLFIIVLLLDTFGGFWWCEGGIWGPNGWVVVWLWPGTTKWQPYKFLTQSHLMET